MPDRRTDGISLEVDSLLGKTSLLIGNILDSLLDFLASRCELIFGSIYKLSQKYVGVNLLRKFAVSYESAGWLGEKIELTLLARNKELSAKEKIKIISFCDCSNQLLGREGR